MIIFLLKIGGLVLMLTACTTQTHIRDWILKVKSEQVDW